MATPNPTSSDRHALLVLILRDQRPGHYNQSEGIAAALARLTPISVTRISVTPRRFFPQRVLRHLLAGSMIDAATLLRLAYRESLTRSAPADIIISAGGATLLANAALARLTGAANIFSGSLRDLPGTLFSAVLIPYRKFASSPHHIVCLKPSPVDPDRAEPAAAFEIAGAARATLLLGGPSSTHRYSDDEWRALFNALPPLATAMNWHWTIVTSPRTPKPMHTMAMTMCEAQSPDFTLVDYRSTGPGSSFSACLNAQVIFVTEDSNSMITEAIVSRRPVIALKPRSRNFSDDEAEYLDDLIRSNFLRSLPIETLSEASVRQALSELTPMRDNHLDILAQTLQQRLAERLPQFGVPARGQDAGR